MPQVGRSVRRPWGAGSLATKICRAFQKQPRACAPRRAGAKCSLTFITPREGLGHHEGTGALTGLSLKLPHRICLLTQTGNAEVTLAAGPPGTESSRATFPVQPAPLPCLCSCLPRLPPSPLNPEEPPGWSPVPGSAPRPPSTGYQSAPQPGSGWLLPLH